MKIKFLGHSAFLVEGSKTLLFDPFLTDNPVAAAKPYDLRPDFILVSHGHSDHFGDALDIAKAADATIISVNELALYAMRRGANAHPMHIGGRQRFAEDLTVKLTTALHGNALIEDGLSQYLGMPCGFLVEMDGLTLYFAGDTALTYDMKAVIGDLNKIDVAMIPIGDNYTMGPEDAVKAVEWLNPRIVIPMHYNTFPLLAQDGGAFAARIETEQPGKKVFPLKPGETLEL
ncbi:MAG: metal-dependent hydrolase [Bacillota bacterium]|jgi:L-ascorbate metabolism protein UlaG (beta-lactamase superfamily)